MNVSPIQDLVSGGWVTGLLYEKVDELLPDSSDYIISSGRPHYDFSQVRLSGFLNPPTGRESLLIKTQYNKWPHNREIVDLKISLHDGETCIYEGTVPNLATGFVSGGMYVPRDNAEKITGFNDLRFGFVAISDSLNSGLVSFWKLNETGGTRFDSYGANHLTSNNQVSYKTGRQDFGAYFISGGTGQYLSVSSDYSLQFGSNDNFTIAGWINLKNPNPNNTNVTMVGWKSLNLANNQEYSLGYRDGSGFAFAMGNGSSYNVVLSNNIYGTSTGIWCLVVGQHDTTNKRQWIRINGNEDIQSGSSVGYGYLNTGTFIIGSDWSNNQHTGIIDEVGIWNRLLTTGEIDRLYNSRQGTTGPFSGSTLNNGLIGYWPLNETGNIKKDLVGGNHLTHVGFIGTGTGLFGQSTFYVPNNTVTGYLSGTNPNNPREYNNSSFTVAVWDYSEAFFVNRSLIGKSNNLNGWLMAHDPIGATRFNFTNNLSQNSIDFGSAIKTGGWNLRIISYNKELSSPYSIFMNGVSSSIGIQRGLVQNFDSPITIGVQANLATKVPKFYSGQIADVAYWNRALTTAEMNELYNQGAGRTYPFNKNSLQDDLVAYWKLDELSGTRYASVGTGDLTDINTVGAVTGKRRNAAYFIGGNQENLQISNVNYMSLPESGDFTFSFWFNLQTTGGTAQVFFAHTEPATVRYRALISGNDNTLSFRVTQDVGAIKSVGQANTVLQTGIWQFAHMGRDTQAGHIFCQINDRQKDITVITGKLMLTSGDFLIGGTPGSFVSGYIDEFGYWKRKLTSGEITYLYNNGAGRTYPFV